MVFLYLLAAVAAFVVLMCLPIFVELRGKAVPDTLSANIDIYLFSFLKIISFNLKAGSKGISYERKRKKKKTFEYVRLANNAKSNLLRSIKIRRIRLVIKANISQSLMSAVYLQTAHILRSFVNKFSDKSIFETTNVFTLSGAAELEFSGIISLTPAQIIYNIIKKSHRTSAQDV